MSNYPSLLLKCAIAQDGDRVDIPETAIEAGTGRISQAEGWGAWNSLPIGEGGIPPKREDFNSALFLVSQFLLWYQQGGVMKYSADLAYEAGNEVFHNGVKYRALVDNGPGTTQGLVSPGSDKTVWKNLDLPSILGGQVSAYYNCRVGGSDGRRLIPWGESDAHEDYILCDGGTDGRGGKVPNLIDRFILPSTVANAGQTGGGDTATTTSAKIAGTVGATTLTLDQIPAHSHTGTTTAAGGHSHTRGTMNITGNHAVDSYAVTATGCFTWAGSVGRESASGHGSARSIYFDASRNWTGSTSTAGEHTHDFSLGTAGGGQSHTHTLDGESHSHSVTMPKPPYYCLAFFVKLPD